MRLPDEPALAAPGRYRTDVAIIGAGIAGLYAALELPPSLHVIVVDKGTPGASGSSPWAQGGMAVPLGADDSPELHAQDTERAGDGLCDPAAVRTLTTEIADHTASLLRLGARFDRLAGMAASTDPHDLHLAREGAQTVARSVHQADATGAEMVRVLRTTVTDRVERLGARAVALARDAAGTRVTGVHVQLPDGSLALIEARAVLLATGGCGGLYAATTNPDHATADGVALAYEAGAAVRDLEFVQFHPTGLALPGSWRFLLTEALRGAGATLHDRDGHRFMVDLHPDAELAPRHVVAKAILDCPDGRAFLDATHLGEEALSEEFPTVLAGVREHGFDLAAERVPVTPAAHYMVGGVVTDLGARTTLPGLYAAGEVASTGLHGANRMAGNSLAEALVFGARAAQAIGRDLPALAASATDPDLSDDADDAEQIRAELRTAMLRGAGPVRSQRGLAALGAELAELRARLGVASDGASLPSKDPQVTELRLAVVAAGLIQRAAELRTESRGGHIREDHPASAASWRDVHVTLVRPRGGTPA